MTTAVVTGANKGIGFEIVRQLLDLGWDVWLGSRDEQRGARAVETLAARSRSGELRSLSIDVGDDASVQAAAQRVAENGGLDVLVNNAGIAGDVVAAADTTAADVTPVLAVNVVGPIRVTNAFLPVLRRSPQPLVVNISSGLGSFAAQTDTAYSGSTYPDLAYPVSKAALNMVTVQYAKQVPEVRFLAVGPGYTATDLNGFEGAQTPTQAAARVVNVITDHDLPSPSYVSAEGVAGW